MNEVNQEQQMIESNPQVPISNIFIGKAIQNVLKEQGRSAVWLAKQLCCYRTNVYDIFNRPTIDTMLLMRISVVLKHNFFKELAEETQEKIINSLN